jgi:hypothetical protein
MRDVGLRHNTAIRVQITRRNWRGTSKIAAQDQSDLLFAYELYSKRELMYPQIRRTRILAACLFRGHRPA